MDKEQARMWFLLGLKRGVEGFVHFLHLRGIDGLVASDVRAAEHVYLWGGDERRDDSFASIIRFEERAFEEVWEAGGIGGGTGVVGERGFPHTGEGGGGGVSAD